jgi:uncharacterized protein YuzB (UPF0349 family)
LFNVFEFVQQGRAAVVMSYALTVKQNVLCHLQICSTYLSLSNREGQRWWCHMPSLLNKMCYVICRFVLHIWVCPTGKGSGGDVISIKISQADDLAVKQNVLSKCNICPAYLAAIVCMTAQGTSTSSLENRCYWYLERNNIQWPIEYQPHGYVPFRKVNNLLYHGPLKGTSCERIWLNKQADGQTMYEKCLL